MADECPLMSMLENYAEAYQEGKRVGFRSTDVLNQVSIWFIPMLNPDGGYTAK